jgi:hypothetical protein
MRAATRGFTIYVYLCDMMGNGSFLDGPMNQCNKQLIWAGLAVTGLVKQL